MSSKNILGKRKRSAQVSHDVTDRISNLPESILSHILSLLPIEDAIATLLLSKGWKLLWRNIHNLSFDDSASHFNQALHTTKEQARLFTYFVNNVFKFLDRQCIDKFSLKIERLLADILDDSLDTQYVTNWFVIAVSLKARGIQFNVSDRFLKDYDNERVYFDMPGSLFTCETIKVLNLSGRINLNVPNLVSLPNLKTLRLENVIYQCDECVVKLISGCSSLETLYVKREDKYDNVVNFSISSSTLRNITLEFSSISEDFPIEFYYTIAINAPQLRYLELFDYRLSKDFSLENLSLLDEAKLDIWTDSPSQQDDNYSKAIVKLFQGIYNVKKLTLMGNELEAFSYASYSISFPRLSQLSLPESFWTHPLLDFVKGSKKLECLEVEVYGRICLQKTSWRKTEEVPTCFLSCLKTISLKGFRFLKDEVEMVAYILKNAKVLRTMTIKPYSYLFKIENYMKLICRMSEFPRGSEKCELHFVF